MISKFEIIGTYFKIFTFLPLNQQLYKTLELTDIFIGGLFCTSNENNTSNNYVKQVRIDIQKATTIIFCKTDFQIEKKKPCIIFTLNENSFLSFQKGLFQKEANFVKKKRKYICFDT